MLETLPLALFDLRFEVPEIVKIALLAIAGLLAYMVFARQTKGETPMQSLAAFPKRAARLLTFVDSLGLATLKPLLQDLSQGNFTAVPGHFERLLDGLDDKQSRAAMLDSFFYSEAGIGRQLADEDRRKKLIARLEAETGLVLAKPKPTS